MCSRSPLGCGAQLVEAVKMFRSPVDPAVVLAAVLGMHVAAVCFMTKRVWRGGGDAAAACIFVLLGDKAITSVMMVVTLQGSCLMSHFE